MNRIVEEELCEHGQHEPHSTEIKELLPGDRWSVEEDWCSGGSRRVLTLDDIADALVKVCLEMNCPSPSSHRGQAIALLNALSDRLAEEPK